MALLRFLESKWINLNSGIFKEWSRKVLECKHPSESLKSNFRDTNNLNALIMSVLFFFFLFP